jgi:hypothetical protein
MRMAGGGIADAVYPMMEHQLAMKGSNLQSMGMAEGGVARFGGGGTMAQPTAEGTARQKYARENKPGIIPSVSDEEWNSYKKLQNLSFPSAASSAQTYKYNPATMQYTDSTGKITGGMDQSFIPPMMMQQMTPEQQIGLTAYQGYAEGGTTKVGDGAYGGRGHSVLNPAQRNTPKIGGGMVPLELAKDMARLNPEYAKQNPASAPVNMDGVANQFGTAPTYTYNPETMQYIDQNGVVTGGMIGYQGYAEGGTANGGYSLGSYSDGGQLLKGPGNGTSDSIPAMIGDHQPARLAEGEFVIPARIVSELGNGSTDAGAKQLYAMMDRVQKARRKTVGKNKVAVDAKSRNMLPA